MIKSTKFMNIITLTFWISFFLFTLSYFILTYSTNLSYFLENTFLSVLGNIITNSVFTWVLMVLRAIGIFLLTGCLIGLILVFYYDVIKKERLI